jgi:predicted nucleotidyltransferase
MNSIGIQLPETEIADFCRRWQISEFSIFGSTLRADFNPESDIDVLVSFLPEANISLFEMVQMQDELENILGRDVDIVSKQGVEHSRNYLRRKSILDSAQVVYVAE